MDTFKELQSIIATYFKIESQLIQLKTTAKDISDWDSFSHMDLMSTIEKHFETTFPFTVLMDFSCVGDINEYLINQQQ